MNYLSLLDLEKEPFSNSPDPDFFFASNQHMRSLQRLELAIRLRKGLSVALGEVGTGKTTICRRLIRRLGEGDGKVSVHLFLDPEFASPLEFLAAIAAAFGIGEIHDDSSEREIKEAIKQFLFREGVDQEKITVLIIDEGQKLPGFCLEILREFLNFETNQHKLLQIVIFTQLEFRQSLRERANFSDRIAELCTLGPLNFADTRRMILFRLRQAHGRSESHNLFSFLAMVAIYWHTGGYPRKIVQLCSQTLLALIIQNKPMVTASLVRACWKRLAGGIMPRPMIFRPALLVLLLAGIVFWQWDRINPATGIQAVQALSSLPSAPPETVLDDSASLPVVPELGRLPISAGDSLGDMIHRIYGYFNNEFLGLVATSNPQIRNLNRLSVGTQIIFPPACLPYKSPDQPGFRLQLGHAFTLAEADRLFRALLDDGVKPLLVPVWESSAGLGFLILMPASYPDQVTASAALQALPLPLRDRVQILHDWEDRYLFVTRCLAK